MMAPDNTLPTLGRLGLGLGILGGLLFGLLQLLHIPVGAAADWVIGLASFWWLLVIVTLPWNLFFQAQAVLNEAKISGQRGIPFEPQSWHYVERLRRWSLRLALGLHGLSAVGFAALTWWDVTPIGYLSAMAALVLTGVRPGIRGYEYLAARLAQLYDQVKVPRQDAIELARQLHGLQTQVDRCQRALDPDQPDSWAQQELSSREFLRHQVALLHAQIEQLSASNHLDHERIGREAQQAIAQLSVDSRFLSQVREILRFVKEA